MPSSVLHQASKMSGHTRLPATTMTTALTTTTTLPASNHINQSPHSSQTRTISKNDVTNSRPTKSGVDVSVGYSSRDDVSTMSHSRDEVSSSRVSFNDREIHEIKVAKETFFKESKDKISPRIASIQKMLANTGISQELAEAVAVAASVPPEIKKVSPPPPPPRHGVVPKSSKPQNLSQAPRPKDAIKPLLPLPGKAQPIYSGDLN